MNTVSDKESPRSKLSTRSAKAKGRKGQQDVVKLLLKSFPELTEDDIRSTPMGSQGEDILLSTAARELLPWNIEVKRGKAFNLVKAVKQAEFRNKPVKCSNQDCEENNCQLCGGTGIRNYQAVGIGRYDQDKTWYATIDLKYLLQLIRNIP